MYLLTYLLIHSLTKEGYRTRHSWTGTRMAGLAITFAFGDEKCDIIWPFLIFIASLAF